MPETKKTKTEKKSPREKEKVAKKPKYWEGVGRRKTATARVIIFSQGKKEMIVNEKGLEEYFPIKVAQEIAVDPLKKLKLLSKFRVSVKVKGGGFSAQAEAIRLGLSRALAKLNPNFQKKLRKIGFLTRDPRMKERKKFGLKRARKAPQWQKR